MGGLPKGVCKEGVKTGARGMATCGGSGFGSCSDERRPGVYAEGSGAGGVGEMKPNADGSYFLVPEEHLVPFADDGQKEEGLIKKAGEDLI